MSAVPGTLALASTRSAASMITASVLVPPTSMPRRQSGAGTGELLHGPVVEVVAELPRAGQRDAGLGPPHRVAAEGDYNHPLAVLDPLGRNRIRGLGVQHRDQVRYRGQYPAPLQRDQVLVLQLQPDEAASVLAQALDHYRATDEATCGMPLDVQDLPCDQ